MSETRSKISRRDFFKKTGIVVSGVAAASALSACGTNTTRYSKGTDSNKPVYEVYDTDVLVIGGGLAAAQAASVAFEQGANVLLVDKGPFRFSGSGGYNWGLATAWANDADASLKTDLMSVEGVVEQNVAKAAYDASQNYQNLAKYMDHGCTLLSRKPDGSFGGMVMNGSVYSFNVFSRHDMDHVKNIGVSVFDRTMITQLLVQNGKCIGAMGIDLTTGAFCVFRAKQTIACAGSASWILGWVTVGARTTSGPDTTGDLTAIAYRNGCKIHQLEFCDLDTIISAPTGIAHSYNAGIGCDPLFNPVFCNKDGERFLEKYPVTTMSRGDFVKEAYKQIKAGKGSPNGGVYIDLRDVNGQPSPYWAFIEDYYHRNLDLMKNNFGIDVRNSLVEVAFNVPDMYGVPVIDATMQTEIPGLYFARSLSNAPSAMTINCAIVAATNAAKAVRTGKVDMPDKISWKSIDDEYSRLQEIMNRKATAPIRPHEVRHMIQKTAGDNLIALRTDEGLNACIKELSRIRTEVMPRMVVSLKTNTYNIEWKQAIENYNMLDFAEMAARASLMRTESRSSCVRPDHPTRDDENWLCWVGVKMVDGKMQTEKFPMDMSLYSAAAVKGIMNPALPMA